ncbi:unnamed protein product [Acanthoscelides obtectus]|uniref:RING-type E3 ubiquitin transferase n=1 Tax=Acanthoscelides obtectus TaxID=200917 RepID=A0A9P0LKC3_ACAOB|nr:unnamed protein product [Acanthoscelides obtectus]CAK1682309.1 Ubiquitin carboxyl-terminal hydrolase 7 [Acanthoscelides obtectus]
MLEVVKSVVCKRCHLPCSVAPVSKGPDTEDIKVSKEDRIKSKATLVLTISDASKWEILQTKRSPLSFVCNLPWKIFARLYSKNDEKMLQVFVECNTESECSSWSCSADVNVRLLTVRPGGKDITRDYKHLFCLKEYNWGYTEFKTWNDVLNPEKGYIKDDIITLEAVVEADPPQGISWSSDQYIGNYFCGRCRPKAEPHTPFEIVAKKIFFPCSFGCSDLLAWGQVLDHEIVCKKRTLICPFPTCYSTTQLSLLRDHIKVQHPLFYQDTRQQIQLVLSSSTPMTRLHGIRDGDYTFLFFIKFELIANNQYCCNFNICLVWPQYIHETELDDVKCRVELSIPAENVKIIKLIFGRDIEMYNDRQHCLSCLYQNCDKMFHENTFDWITEKVIVYTKSSVKSNVFYSIAPYKQERVTYLAPENLECPVCFEYMTDQIINCANGHSFCQNCKASIENCPICRTTLSDSRNYALEKLVKSLKIACRRSTTGCAFVGTVNRVKVHEKSCKEP